MRSSSHPTRRDSPDLPTLLLAVFARVRPVVVLLGLLAAVGLLVVSLPAPVVGVLWMTAGLLAGLLVACTLPFAVVRLVTAGLDATTTVVGRPRRG